MYFFRKISSLYNFKFYWSTTLRRLYSMESSEFSCKPLKIGTHDGRFHCDEILACFMLQSLEKYKNAEIVRTRNESVLNSCDIVIDVGAIFDKTKNKFDHHQRSFNETFSSLRPELGLCSDIRLSSAGLIYIYFGEEVIKNMLKKENLSVSDIALQLIYKKIYENFIKEIDAIDNGIQICDGEPLYHIRTHLSARIDKFNPSWNHKGPINEQNLFEQAKEVVGKEFTETILNYATLWLPAREIVENSIENSKNVYDTGEILELKRPCPWKEHLSELEVTHKIIGIPKYILMKDEIENTWRIICVPRKPNSFICRKFLHKDWRGLRNNELQNVSGINDAIFCHATGFVGGAISREGVLQMGIKSLQGNYID